MAQSFTLKHSFGREWLKVLLQSISLEGNGSKFYFEAFLWKGIAQSFTSKHFFGRE